MNYKKGVLFLVVTAFSVSYAADEAQPGWLQAYMPSAVPSGLNTVKAISKVAALPFGFGGLGTAAGSGLGYGLGYGLGGYLGFDPHESGMMGAGFVGTGMGLFLGVN